MSRAQWLGVIRRSEADRPRLPANELAGNTSTKSLRDCSPASRLPPTRCSRQVSRSVQGARTPVPPPVCFGGGTGGPATRRDVAPVRQGEGPREAAALPHGPVTAPPPTGPPTSHPVPAPILPIPPRTRLALS